MALGYVSHNRQVRIQRDRYILNSTSSKMDNIDFAQKTLVFFLHFLTSMCSKPRMRS